MVCCVDSQKCGVRDRSWGESGWVAVRRKTCSENSKHWMPDFGFWATKESLHVLGTHDVKLGWGSWLIHHNLLVSLAEQTVMAKWPDTTTRPTKQALTNSPLPQHPQTLIPRVVHWGGIKGVSRFPIWTHGETWPRFGPLAVQIARALSFFLIFFTEAWCFSATYY